MPPPALARTRSLADAARFVAQLNFDRSPDDVRVRSTAIGEAQAVVVEPRARRVRGTILLLHGVAPSGGSDPRILAVGRAAAGRGFRVVVPQIEPFARCELSPDGVRWIRDAIVGCAGRADLCPDGRLSIFGACVSAGFGLVAACEEEAAERVDAILCLGAYAEMEALLEHLLGAGPGLGDDYGRAVLLYNYAGAVTDAVDEQVREALRLRILDDHLGNLTGEGGRVEAFLRGRPATRRTLAGIDDAGFRRELLRVVRERHGQSFARLSPLGQLERLRCRELVLVHGEDDPIIPPVESERLRDRARVLGLPGVRHCLTPLIEHGDKRPIGPALAVEAARLVSAFAAFFRGAAPGEGTGRARSTPARASAAGTAPDAPTPRAA